MIFRTILPPMLLMFGLLVIYFFVLFLLRSHFRQKKRRSLITSNFLRSPGQSLGSKIDCLHQEISFYFVLLVAIPLIFYSGFLSTFYVVKRQYEPQEVALWLISGTILVIFFLLKTLKRLKKRRRLRLGYEGAVAA